ncbi:MAG TPA: outer membrane lipoprotein-sorting protein [Terracidiphilus sp.]|nr:outer membrane lipoprotein-sorting protein [Terracidiphilus sp.]
MDVMRKLVPALPALLLLLPAHPVLAADPLSAILHQLDEASRSFHSASADLEWKSIQTEPIPETDIKTGKVYYDRKDSDLRMAAHFKTYNGQPFDQAYTVANGVVELYDGATNHATTYHAANLASYAMFGDGASGKDLQEKFDVTSLGEETIDGVKTDKLQLIPKDPKVLNTFHKIVMWIDPVRDVNLKMVFDEGDGQSLVLTYSKIKVNIPVSREDLTFKTNGKTTYSNQ